MCFYEVNAKIAVGSFFAINIITIFSPNQLNTVLLRRGLDALSKCHQMPPKMPGRLAAEVVIDKLAHLVVDEAFDEECKMIILQAVVKQVGDVVGWFGPVE